MLIRFWGLPFNRYSSVLFKIIAILSLQSEILLHRITPNFIYKVLTTRKNSDKIYVHHRLGKYESSINPMVTK